jgi:biotin carboxyl carrier protein
MTFEIEVDGRVRTVSIENIGAVGPEGGRFRVTLRQPAADGSDGLASTVTLDARPTDVGVSLLFAETGRSLDLAVTPLANGEHFVQLPHVGVTAIVEGRRARRSGSGESAGTGEQRILAPMPGRVVRVLVKPGDEVAARQGLVVVEAMKMENELTAARAGRVKDVGVAEGQSVQAGQLLVIVE